MTIVTVAAEIRRILRSSLARNVGGMMALTAAGQAIYLLTGPLIGRLFSPAEFGLYGLFYSFAITAAGVTFLNFDLAIPAADSDEDARLVTLGAIVVMLGMILTITGVMAALIVLDVAGFGQLSLLAAGLLVPVLLAQGIVQLLQSWRVRTNETLVIGKSTIALNVIRGLTQIGVGWLFPLWWALVAGEITGRIANAIYLFRGKFSYRRSGISYTLNDIKSALGRYRKFATVLLPAQFLDSIVVLLQSAGLAYIYGSPALGVFFLMRRTLDMPVAFVFRSLSDVFYARLAQDTRVAPERVRPFFLKSGFALMATGMVVAIPFMFAAPSLFAIFFGEEWREAGVLAAIMIPASVLNIAVAPVARIFALTHRPGLRFAFSIVMSVTTCIVLATAYWFGLSLRETTIGLSMSAFLAYLTYFVAGYVACSHLRTGMA